jgi:microcystin-dependent protein
MPGFDDRLDLLTHKLLHQQQSGSVSGDLVGEVKIWLTGTIPSGHLLLNGQTVSRTLYAALFKLWGTTFGAGDGSTTFGLPNMKGVFPVGVDAAQTEFAALAQTGGSKTGYQQHNHTASTDTPSTDHAHNVYARNQDTGYCNSNWTHYHGAYIGNTIYNFATGHGHHDRGGYAAEGPWEDARIPGATIPVNVYNTDTNHTHNFNHDHPSTNYQSEAPWHGNYTHGHAVTINNNGTASGNLVPYFAVNFIVRY